MPVYTGQIPLMVTESLLITVSYNFPLDGSGYCNAHPERKKATIGPIPVITLFILVDIHCFQSLFNLLVAMKAPFRTTDKIRQQLCMFII